jgi:hypothetical protein
MKYKDCYYYQENKKCIKVSSEICIRGLYSNDCGFYKKATKCKECNRTIEEPYIFCSYECACYAGYFSVRKGWIKDPKELKNK